MTPLKSVPEKSSRPKDFKNKDCFVRQTNQSLHNLGKINEEELIVKFPNVDGL
uniref:Uncharacterized protein n=1 Tax=Meloidogyne enterolobii TaxID=390850 RepID=A0A6V7U1B3_MELEN|nr:unnamed protein product [Meloidogyne enterolobii]